MPFVPWIRHCLYFWFPTFKRAKGKIKVDNLGWENQPTSWCRDIHLETKWPLFWLEFRPCFGGLTFKNRGRLGSRFYMDIMKGCHFWQGPGLCIPPILGRSKCTKRISIPNFFRQIGGKFSVRKWTRFFCTAQKKNFLRWPDSLFFFECSPPGDSQWPFYISFYPLFWRSLNLSKGRKTPSQEGHKELLGQYFSCAILFWRIYFFPRLA